MIEEVWSEALIKGLDVLSSWTILFLGLLIAILSYISWRQPEHKKVSFWSMVVGIITACCSIVSHLCGSTISDWDKASLRGALATITDQSNRLTSAKIEINQLRQRTGQRRIKDGTQSVLDFMDAVKTNGLAHGPAWHDGVRQWPNGREKRIGISFCLGDHEASVFAWDLRFLLQQFFDVPKTINAYFGGNDGITIFFDDPTSPTPEALALGKALQQLGYSIKLRYVPSTLVISGDAGHKQDFVLHIGAKVDTDPVDTACETNGL